MINKLLFLLFALGITALPAWAVDTTGLDNINPTFSDVYSLSDEILKKIPYFLGGLAFLAILYSGAIYITSFGDPARMESAKKNLTWTVTGILAVMAVYGIMSVIMWIANTAAVTI